MLYFNQINTALVSFGKKKDFFKLVTSSVYLSICFWLRTYWYMQSSWDDMPWSKQTDCGKVDRRAVNTFSDGQTDIWLRWIHSLTLQSKYWHNSQTGFDLMRQKLWHWSLCLIPPPTASWRPPAFSLPLSLHYTLFKESESIGKDQASRTPDPCSSLTLQSDSTET